MHKVRLTYAFATGDDTPAAARAQDDAAVDLHHPLMALLQAVHASGSISAAARGLGLSYRHVWGELKRWETDLGRPLVSWSKGQPSSLSPFGEKLLWAERRARARLAPQIEALRGELELAFAVAFDDTAQLVSMVASHDEALPRLRALARDQAGLLLDIRFGGSVEALQALAAGHCLLAGFHAVTNAASGAPTALAYRPLLKPGRHKLIGFVRRTQGLMLAPGNPLRVAGLHDLARPGLRFVHRGGGAGTRLVLAELLQAAGLPMPPGPEEPSHRAVAQAVASGSADAGLGIEAVARAAGLDFVALAEERYFLVTLAEHLEDPQVQALRALLRSPAWAAEVAALPGHAPDAPGEVLSLRRVLPWWTYKRAK
jgi:putative molybdopterin biosynthesis protein